MADDEYQKKLKDLQRYVPFLENTIKRLKTESGKPREAQITKLQSLLVILTDTKKKLKYDALRKCEEVILKLYEKVEKKPTTEAMHKYMCRTPPEFAPKNPSPTLDDSEVAFSVARQKLNKQLELNTPASPSPTSLDIPGASNPIAPVVIPTEKVINDGQNVFYPIKNDLLNPQHHVPYGNEFDGPWPETFTSVPTPHNQNTLNWPPNVFMNNQIQQPYFQPQIGNQPWVKEPLFSRRNEMNKALEPRTPDQKFHVWENVTITKGVSEPRQIVDYSDDFSGDGILSFEDSPPKPVPPPKIQIAPKKDKKPVKISFSDSKKPVSALSKIISKPPLTESDLQDLLSSNSTNSPKSGEQSPLVDDNMDLDKLEELKAKLCKELEESKPVPKKTTVKSQICLPHVKPKSPRVVERVIKEQDNIFGNLLSSIDEQIIVKSKEHKKTDKKDSVKKEDSVKKDSKQSDSKNVVKKDEKTDKHKDKSRDKSKDKEKSKTEDKTASKDKTENKSEVTKLKEKAKSIIAKDDPKPKEEPSKIKKDEKESSKPKDSSKNKSVIAKDDPKPKEESKKVKKDEKESSKTKDSSKNKKESKPKETKHDNKTSASEKTKPKNDKIKSDSKDDKIKSDSKNDKSKRILTKESENIDMLKKEESIIKCEDLKKLAAKKAQADLAKILTDKKIPSNIAKEDEKAALFGRLSDKYPHKRKPSIDTKPENSMPDVLKELFAPKTTKPLTTEVHPIKLQDPRLRNNPGMLSPTSQQSISPEKKFPHNPGFNTPQEQFQKNLYPGIKPLLGVTLSLDQFSPNNCGNRTLLSDPFLNSGPQSMLNRTPSDPFLNMNKNMPPTDHRIGNMGPNVQRMPLLSTPIIDIDPFTNNMGCNTPGDSFLNNMGNNRQPDNPFLDNNMTSRTPGDIFANNMGNRNPGDIFSNNMGNRAQGDPFSNCVSQIMGNRTPVDPFLNNMGNRTPADPFLDDNFGSRTPADPFSNSGSQIMGNQTPGDPFLNMGTNYDQGLNLNDFSQFSDNQQSGEIWGPNEQFMNMPNPDQFGRQNNEFMNRPNPEFQNRAIHSQNEPQNQRFQNNGPNFNPRFPNSNNNRQNTNNFQQDNYDLSKMNPIDFYDGDNNQERRSSFEDKSRSLRGHGGPINRGRGGRGQPRNIQWVNPIIRDDKVKQNEDYSRKNRFDRHQNEENIKDPRKSRLEETKRYEENKSQSRPKFEENRNQSRPRIEENRSQSRPRFEESRSQSRPRFEENRSQSRPRFEGRHDPRSRFDSRARSESRHFDNKNEEDRRKSRTQNEDVPKREDPRKQSSLYKNMFDKKPEEKSSLTSGNESQKKNEEIYSPLDALYSSEPKKIGRGYGIQNFKIPKIRKSVEESKEETKTETIDPKTEDTKVSLDSEVIEEIKDDEKETAEVEKESEKCEEIIKKPEEKEEVKVEATSSKEDKSESTDTKPKTEADEKLEMFNSFMKHIFNTCDSSVLLQYLDKCGFSLPQSKTKKIRRIIDSDSDSEDEETTKDEEEIAKDEEVLKKDESTATEVEEKIEEPKKEEFEEPKTPENKTEENVSDEVVETVGERIKNRRRKHIIYSSDSSPDKTLTINEESPDVKKTTKKKVRKTKQVPKTRRKNALELLQEDLRDMFISKGVLTATGKRMCRVMKEHQEKFEIEPTKKDQNVPTTSDDEDVPLVRRKGPKVTKKQKKDETKEPAEDVRKLPMRKARSSPRVLLEKINFPALKSSSEDESDSELKKEFVEPETVPVRRTRSSAVSLREPEVKLDPPATKPDPETTKTEPEIKQDTIASPKKVPLKRGPRKRKKKPDPQTHSEEIEDTESIVSSNIDSLGDLTEFETEKPVSEKKKPAKKKRSSWALGVIKKDKRKRPNKNMTSSPTPSFEINDQLSETAEHESERAESDADVDVTDITQEDDFNNEGSLLKIDCKPDVNYYYEKKNRFDCKLCDYSGKFIVHHYRFSHPDSENMISRLSPEQADHAKNESKLNKFEEIVAYDEINKTRKRRTSYSCRFCGLNFGQDIATNFFDHLCSHTGEYRYSCTECVFYTSNKKQLSQHCNNHPNLKRPLHIVPIWAGPPNFRLVFGYLCSACNFTQLLKHNVEKHIKLSHPDENIEIIKISMSSKPISLDDLSPSKQKEIEVDEIEPEHEEKLSEDEEEQDSEPEEQPPEPEKLPEPVKEPNINAFLESDDCSFREKAIEDERRKKMEEISSNITPRRSGLSFVEKLKNRLQNQMSGLDEEQKASEDEANNPIDPPNIEEINLDTDLNLQITNTRSLEDSLNEENALESTENDTLKIASTCSLADFDLSDNDTQKSFEDFDTSDLILRLTDDEIDDNPVKMDISDVEFNHPGASKQKGGVLDTIQRLAAKLQPQKNVSDDESMSAPEICIKTEPHTEEEPLNMVESLNEAQSVNEAPPQLEELSENEEMVIDVGVIELHLRNKKSEQYYICKAPDCNFVTSYKISFTKHCSDSHVKLSVECEICKNLGIQMRPFTMTSLFVHLIDKHKNSATVRTKKVESVPTGKIRLRRISGDLLSKPTVPEPVELIPEPTELISGPSELIPGSTELESDNNHLQPLLEALNQPIIFEPAGESLETVLEPLGAVLKPLNPIEPTNSILEPINPVLEPMNPVLEPINPVLEPINPVLEPINPVLEPPQLGFLQIQNVRTLTPEEENKIMPDKQPTITTAPQISPVTFSDSQLVTITSQMGPQSLLSKNVTNTTSVNSKVIMSSIANAKLVTSEPSTSAVFIATRTPGTKVLGKKVIYPLGKVLTVKRPIKKQCVETEILSSHKTKKVFSTMIKFPNILDLYKCPIELCSYSTNERTSFTLHFKNHRWCQITTCVYCSEGVSSDNIVPHIDKFHGHCSIQCAYCFYRTISKNYLIVHQGSAHLYRLPPVINENYYLIRPNLVNFFTVDINEEQVIRKNVILPYLCRQKDCESKFLIAEDFMVHLHVFHKKQFECCLCPEKNLKNVSFTTAQALIKHFQLHNVAKYQCKFCLHGTNDLNSMFAHYARKHQNMKSVCFIRQFQNKTNNAIDDILTIDMEGRILYNIEPTAAIKTPPEKSPKVVTQPEPQIEETKPNPTKPNTLEEGEIRTSSLIDVIDLVEENPESNQTGDELSEPLVTLKHRSVESKNAVENAIDPLSGDNFESVENVNFNEIISTKPEVVLTPEKEKSPEIPKTAGVVDGLSGQDLYRCGNKNCNFQSNLPFDFKEHLFTCNIMSTDFICIHCKSIFYSVVDICEHIQVHGSKRFICDICSFKSALSTEIVKHMRDEHQTNYTKFYPCVSTLRDMTKDEFRVKPVNRRPEPAETVDEPPIFTPKTIQKQFDLKRKLVFGPNEIDALPRPPIYQTEIKCELCNFSTKVRYNMQRHLQQHIDEKAVSETVPINPVPCLEKNEKMFDKMTNLAASSHYGRMGAKSAEKVDKNTKEDSSNYPGFISVSKRFVCGAENCNYLTHGDTMLRHHLTALHADELVYKCPHCHINIPPEVDGLEIDKILFHLKMHDLHLYKCPNCDFFHYQKHKIEKHISDNHSGENTTIEIIRELDSSANLEDARPSLPPNFLEQMSEVNENKCWRCGLCAYKTASRSEIINHASTIHNTKSQFKCGFCSLKCSAKNNFPAHFRKSHPDEEVKIITVYYKSTDTPEEFSNTSSDDFQETPTFDTTPIWVKNKSAVKHIRGILLEEAKSPSKRTPKIIEKLTEIKSNLGEGTSKNIDDITKNLFSETSTTVKDSKKINKDGKSAVLTVKYPSSYGLPDGKFFVCPSCNKFKTKSVQEFIEHLYVEMNYFRCTCSICQMRFIDISRAKLHWSEKHNSDEGSEEKITPITPNGKVENWIDCCIRHQHKKMKKPKPKGDDSPLLQDAASESSVVAPSMENFNEDLIELNVFEDDAAIYPEKNDQESNKTVLTNSPPKLKCEHCEFVAKTNQTLKKHLKRHYTNHTIKCNLCNFGTFSSQSMLQHHRAKHKTEEISFTQISEPAGPIIRPLKRKRQSQEPDKQDSPPNKSTREEIDPLQTSEDSLKTSEAVSEAKASDFDVVYVCLHCPRKSEDLEIVRTHFLTSHERQKGLFKYKKITVDKVRKTKYRCNYCEWLGCQDGLKQHHLEQHPSKLWVCHKTNKYRCGICDAIFLSINSLKKHFNRLHSGENLCYKTVLEGNEEEVLETTEFFTDLIDVKPEVKSKCDYCSDVFTSLEQLLSHHNLLHSHLELKIKDDAIEELKKFKCPQCGHGSNSYPAMRDHLRSHHKPFICTHCNQFFAYPNLVKSHHLKEHRNLTLEIIEDPETKKQMDNLRVNMLHLNPDGTYSVRNKSLKRPQNESIDEPPKKVIILEGPKKNVAKKSTSLPARPKNVAKKSTSNRPTQPEGFSFYGSKPADINDYRNVMSEINIMGKAMPINVVAMSHVLNLFPKIEVRDCKDAPELQNL